MVGFWPFWFVQALKACQTAAPAAADALERLSPGGMCGRESDRDGILHRKLDEIE